MSRLRALACDYVPPEVRNTNTRSPKSPDSDVHAVRGLGRALRLTAILWLVFCAWVVVCANQDTIGGPISSVFSDITPEPVAAASLGQVYRATLKSSGEEVAVKVQRPSIESTIYQDLVLFRFLAGFVNEYVRKNLGTSAQVRPLPRPPATIRRASSATCCDLFFFGRC